MEPLVEIVLVNYNGYEDTIECIESLKRINYTNYRVVVVNNGSPTAPTKEQESYLRANAIYVESPENNGFAEGNNYAIRETAYLRPDYLLLLNNDTVVCPDFLQKLVAVAQERDDAGIVCGKINYYDEKDRIWFGGGDFDSITGTKKHILLDQADRDDTDFVRDDEFATGCLMLIPRAVWEAVGPMEGRLFLYGEDVDFSRQVRGAGYRIYYCNAAKIYHKLSRSTGKTSDNTLYYGIRNDLYVMQRYAKNRWVAYGIKLVRTAAAVVVKRKRVAPILEGVRDFAKGRYGRRGAEERGREQENGKKRL